jgi:hypothetical protein
MTVDFHQAEQLATLDHESLRVVRDRAAGRLLDGDSDLLAREPGVDPFQDDFVEVALVNRLLGEDAQTCVLYRELQRRSPAHAAGCAAAARPVLRRCGRLRPDDA